MSFPFTDSLRPSCPSTGERSWITLTLCSHPAGGTNWAQPAVWFGMYDTLRLISLRQGQQRAAARSLLSVLPPSLPALFPAPKSEVSHSSATAPNRPLNLRPLFGSLPAEGLLHHAAGVGEGAFASVAREDPLLRSSRACCPKASFAPLPRPSVGPLASCTAGSTGMVPSPQPEPCSFLGPEPPSRARNVAPTNCWVALGLTVISLSNQGVLKTRCPRNTPERH